MNLDVVIVAYESAPHLPTVLEALPTDVGVFVIDNASTDNSAEIAESHGATVVRGTVNAGFAAACNRGAALGDAKTILFLNPDASIDADSVERLVDVFYDDPQIGVASPRLERPDGSKQRVQWPYPSAADAWREAFGVHRRVEESDGGFVVGACLAVRREAFEAVGGFDERFWLYGEEADLCRRIADLGWTVERIPAATATHIGGASGGGEPTRNPLVGEHFIRGGEHFVAKHEGTAALVSYRVANLVGSMGRGALGVGARSDEHRRRARRLARTVVTAPTRVALDSPATNEPGNGLVVCSLEPWDDVWRRNQFFVRELLAADPDLRVLFVEPPFDVVHERRRRSTRRRRVGLRPVDVDGRIVRFEPVKWLPRRVTRAVDGWRDDQVLDAARQLGFHRPALWVNDPSYATLADRVDWPVVYDITDDWTEVADVDGAAKVRAWEDRLFDRCEAVTVCSPGLLESRKARRADLTLVPNAVDADHFTRPRTRPVDLPDAPTAVYVGTLHTDRIDVDLVCDLAGGIPGLSVVLVGPDSLDPTSRARLDRAGVIRLGSRPYDEVPGYLQFADVVIVPHVVTPFTENLDPIKAYECLAVGTPTVSTRVAGFRDVGPPVLAVSRDAFVGTVGDVVADPPEVRPRPVPSWSDRADDFRAALDVAVGVRGRARDLRTVFFDHCAQLSGGELALARTVPALSGVEAMVILGEHGPLETVLAERGVETEILELDKELAHTNRFDATASLARVHTLTATARAVIALRGRLRELRPDVLHTNSLKSALIGGAAGRLAGVPVVWHIRDRMATDYLPQSAIRLVRAASHVLPTAIITNSNATREALGNPTVTVIPSPSDVDGYANVVPISDENRPLRAVMAGRLAPWKGQQVFIEAFARAFGDGAETAIIAGEALFGEHEFVDSLHRLESELGVDARIEFRGFVDDVPSLLSETDVLVHASTVAEPFGQVIVEGMAAGLPVIATDAGGPAEIITHDVDGHLVTPGDVDQLADALRLLADDPERRARLGAAARRRARDFSPDAVAPLVEQVLRSVTPDR